VVERDLGGEDGVSQRLGGALRVLVPPAVLNLGVGARSVAIEALLMVGRIEAADKAQPLPSDSSSKVRKTSNL
jgi:hypothetical protein